jgi:hypothetical protein
MVINLTQARISKRHEKGFGKGVCEGPLKKGLEMRLSGPGQAKCVARKVRLDRRDGTMASAAVGQEEDEDR